MSDISHEEASGRGRFHVAAEGGEAELTYALRGATMVIDRTFVPPAARGGDIAMRLVRRAIDEAQKRGLKVAPQCSYVARVFDFMPEWRSLRAPTAS